MTRSYTRAVLAVALAGGLTVHALGQSKTDFSGAWTLDTEKSDPMRGPAGGGPMTLKITQTAADLTIERGMGGRSLKTVYKLDGSESVNQGPRGGEQRSKSHWEGGALITESVQQMSTPGGEATIEMKETRTLQDDKTMLVVTWTRSPRGENTRTAVFKKS